MTLEEFKLSQAYQYALWCTEKDNRCVNKYIRILCANFIYEINNQDKIDYIFDLKMAAKIMKLMQLIKFATGAVAGKTLYESCVGYQYFLVLNIFCWKEKANFNKRRYEVCLLWIARKNSKSVNSGLFMILLMLLEPQYSEFYLCANTREQAKIVFNETSKLINSSPAIKKHFSIKRDVIECKLNNNTLKALSSDYNTTDGLRVSGACIDECGASKDGMLIESMASGMLSVENRLLILISTSYPNTTNPFLEWTSYAQRVLDGITEDKKLFAMLYSLDEEDFKSAEENCLTVEQMMKANPLQATLKQGREYLESEYNKALNMGGAKLTSFKTKHLNIWLSGAVGEEYINIQDLQKCKIEKDSFSFYGKTVFCGFDMARTGDNTSFSIICYEDGEVYSKNFAFYPADKTEQKTREEKVNYYEMDAKGYSVPVGDIFVNIKEIFEFIIRIKEEYQLDIELFGYDQRDMTGLAQMLENAGIPTIAIPQHSKYLGQPIKMLEQYILQGKFFYEENDLLEINFSNCKCTYDTNNTKYINKKKSKSTKIDMVFSLLNAIYLLNNKLINELEDEFCFQVF